MVLLVLGRDHALLGGLGYFAVAPIFVSNLGWQELGVGAVTSAAFALLPDIDEPNSTVSRKLGPISRGVSQLTREAAGGHRQATHSLFFATLVGLLTWLATTRALAVAILIAASFLLVLRMLLPKMLRYVPLIGIGSLGLTFGAAEWALHLQRAGGSDSWLFVATAGGCVWHLVGDSLTPEGVPWFWVPMVPSLQHIRVSIPLVGHTGSARESLLGGVMCLALLWVAFASVLAPASQGLSHGSIPLAHLDLFGWFHTHVLSRVHLPNPSQAAHVK